MGILSSIFGGPKADLKELVKKGAVIVDVRTPGEYAGGHIKGSINIPLQNLDKNLGKLNKDKTIITCCASGMRSSSAKSLLKAKGYDVHNGGGWTSLQAKLR
jgi:rhodanese-related sulfurtransferase